MFSSVTLIYRQILSLNRFDEFSEDWFNSFRSSYEIHLREQKRINIQAMIAELNYILGLFKDDLEKIKKSSGNEEFKANLNKIIDDIALALNTLKTVTVLKTPDTVTVFNQSDDFILLPKVHEKFDPNDLWENDRVVNATKIDEIKESFKKNTQPPILVYLKNNNELPIEIIRLKKKKDGSDGYYALYKEISSGAFGHVFIAQDLDSGDFCAVKKAKNTGDGNKLTIAISALKQEKENLAKLNELIAASDDESQNAFYIAMPLIPGVTLQDAMKRNHSAYFQLMVVEKFAEQVHTFFTEWGLLCDIKPLNAMFNERTGQVLLIDKSDIFFWDEKDKPISITTENIIGTYQLMPPELRKAADELWLRVPEKPRVDYTEATVVYTLGRSIAKMLGLWETFSPNEEKFLDQAAIRHRKYQYFNKILPIEEIEHPILPRQLLKRILQYLQYMLDDNPANRPTLAKVVNFMYLLRVNYLHLLAEFRNNAIINVNDLSNITSRTTKLLKNFNEVWIYSADEKLPSNLVETKMRLKKQGINLAGIVCRHPEKLNSSSIEEDLGKLPDYLDKERPDSINSYFYIDPTNSLQDKQTALLKQRVNIIAPDNHFPQKIIDRSLITTKQLDFVLGELYKERNRLTDRTSKATGQNEKGVLKSRIGYISKTIKQISKHSADGDLTIDLLKTCLRELENQMVHARSSCLSFFWNPKGKEVVRRISQTVVENTRLLTKKLRH